MCKKYDRKRRCALTHQKKASIFPTYIFFVVAPSILTENYYFWEVVDSRKRVVEAHYLHWLKP